MLLSSAAEAQSLRCDGRILAVGDRPFDAIVICGEPDLRAPVRLELPGGGLALPYEEVWYYNFGPRRLLRAVRIRGERIVAIESLGYGFPVDSPGACRPEDLRAGMSALELRARCGEPADRRQRLRSFAAGAHHPLAPAAAMIEEQWIYDFGPRRLYRVVTLVEGRIADVQTGRRGAGP
jgi:hypothetical protein